MKPRFAALLALPLLSAAQSDDRFPPVQLWQCLPGSATQSWALNATEQPAGQVRIALNASLLWDLSGPTNTTGTAVHLVHPFASTYASQRWRFDVARGGTIESVFAPGKCASPAVAVAGAPLVLAPCASPDVARFTFDAARGVLTLAGDATLCVDSGSAASCATPPTSAFPFCDERAAPAARAADLAGRLVDGELASLLSNTNFGLPRFGLARVGFGEALHGSLAACVETPAPGSSGCPTSFPHLHLLGGSFNRSLWHAIASAIADEGRAYFNLVNRSSHLITWAADINPLRDPRWGRGQEVRWPFLLPALEPPPLLTPQTCPDRLPRRTRCTFQSLRTSTRAGCRRATTRATSSSCRQQSTGRAMTSRTRQMRMVTRSRA